MSAGEIAKRVLERDPDLQRLMDEAVRLWGEGETPNRLARKLAEVLNRERALARAYLEAEKALRKIKDYPRSLRYVQAGIDMRDIATNSLKKIEEVA